MTAPPRMVISDRRDQLGGRIIPLLNAMNISHHTGAKLTLTWNRFVVPTLDEIFRGEIIAPYDCASGTGSLIETEQVDKVASCRDVRIVASSEAEIIGIPDVLVDPVFSDNPDIPYVVDRRFSLYRVNKEQRYGDVKTQLSMRFKEILKAPVIEDAFSYIEETLPESANLGALHVRRMHLLSETVHQINRFDSYCATKLCFALLDSMGHFDNILVGCDSADFVEHIQERYPQKVLSLRQVLDLGKFSIMQQALVDMYFLSRAKAIYGPLGAYGFAASLIGNGSFHNMLIYAARAGIEVGDETLSVSYYRARSRGELGPFAASLAPKPNTSALHHRLALHFDSEVGANMAAKALALRFIEYPHMGFPLNKMPYPLTQHGVETAFLQVFCLTIKRCSNDNPLLLGVADLLNRLLTTRALTDIEILADTVANLADASRSVIVQCLKLASLTVIGDMYNAHEQLDKATEAYRQARGLADLLGMAGRCLEVRLATISYRQNDMKNEIAALRLAVARDPEFAYSHFILGDALHRAGHPAEAADEYDRAIELEVEYGQFWYARAKLAVAERDLERAIQCYKRAVLCEPTAQEFHAALSRVLAEQGRLDEALRAARNASELPPPNAYHRAYLGDLLAQKGDLVAAEAELRAAIKSAPNVAGFHNLLAVALSRQNRHEEAVTSVRQALEIAPNNAYFHAHLADLLARNTDNADEAIANMRKAHEIDPANQYFRKRIDEIAGIRKALGDTQVAPC